MSPEKAKLKKFSENKITFLALGAIVFAAGALVGVTTLPSFYKTSANSTSNYQLKQDIQKQGFSVAVNSITQDTASVPGIKPSPGSMFVNINMTIKNTGLTELSFLPALQATVKDESSVVHSLTLTPSAQGVLAGKLAAGDKVTGDLGFEVPTGTKAVKFYFDPGWNNIEPVIFNLAVQ